MFLEQRNLEVKLTNKKSKAWTKFSNGLPNISVRDIAIQKEKMI